MELCQEHTNFTYSLSDVVHIVELKVTQCSMSNNDTSNTDLASVCGGPYYDEQNNLWVPINNSGDVIHQQVFTVDMPISASNPLGQPLKVVWSEQVERIFNTPLKQIRELKPLVRDLRSANSDLLADKKIVHDILCKYKNAGFLSRLKFLFTGEM